MPKALCSTADAYTMTFPKAALPPVDRLRGGFWLLTMYDKFSCNTAGPYILVKRDGGDLVRRPIYVRSTSKRIEGRVRYLGIGVDDELAIAEEVEV